MCGEATVMNRPRFLEPTERPFRCALADQCLEHDPDDGCPYGPDGNGQDGCHAYIDISCPTCGADMDPNERKCLSCGYQVGDK